MTLPCYSLFHANELDAKPALSIEVASNDPCEVMTAMLLGKAKKPFRKSLCAGDRQ